MPFEPDIIEALVRTIEIKDLCTAAHTWRVVMYTRVLAEKLGHDEQTLRRLSIAAALHDIGKIDIPDEILQKPGPLTEEEYAQMKQHTVLGWARLMRMGEDDPLLLSVIRHHHEHVDGTGYPDAIAGEELHAAARLFAVVDAFDAMTSVRPYQTSLPAHAPERAIARIESESGTHFCTSAVKTLVDAYRAGDLDWILNNFNDPDSLPTFTGHEAAEFFTMRLRPKSTNTATGQPPVR